MARLREDGGKRGKGWKRGKVNKEPNGDNRRLFGPESKCNYSGGSERERIKKQYVWLRSLPWRRHYDRPLLGWVYYRKILNYYLGKDPVLVKIWYLPRWSTVWGCFLERNMCACHVTAGQKVQCEEPARVVVFQSALMITIYHFWLAWRKSKHRHTLVRSTSWCKISLIRNRLYLPRASSIVPEIWNVFRRGNWEYRVVR